MRSSRSEASFDRLACRGLVAIALAAIVPTVDSTISIVAVPAQGRAFGSGFAIEQWMLNLAPLAITLLLVPAGLAADHYGRRRLLRIGLSAMCAGAALSACAPGAAMLLAGRALSGAGGACVLPATIALVRQHSPRTSTRTRRFGLLAGWAGLAAAIGPLAGGLLVDHGSWRWVYIVPAALAAIALAGSGAIADDDTRTHARSALAEAIRSVARGEVSPNCLAGNAITFALYFGLFGVSYLLVVGGQGPLRWSATRAALSMVPMSLALWAGAERLSAFAHRIGTRALMTTALVAAAAGLAWTGYGVTTGGDGWHIVPGTIVFGLAVAAAAGPLTHAAVTSLPGAVGGLGAAVHHAVVRAAGLAATLGLGALALGENGTASAAGVSSALLVGAAFVCVAGLAAVGMLDDRRAGSVPPDDRPAVLAPESGAHGSVGHHASMS